MLAVICIIILLITVKPVTANDWTRQDTYYQAGYTMLLFADYLQTMEIIEDGSLYETNPILGRYPSKQETSAYFASCAITAAVAAFLLPPKQRRWLYIFLIGIESNTIYHNYQIGIRINF